MIGQAAEAHYKGPDEASAIILHQIAEFSFHPIGFVLRHDDNKGSAQRLSPHLICNFP